jgi:hypothetical protein
VVRLAHRFFCLFVCFLFPHQASRIKLPASNFLHQTTASNIPERFERTSVHATMFGATATFLLQSRQTRAWHLSIVQPHNECTVFALVRASRFIALNLGGSVAV